MSPRFSRRRFIEVTGLSGLASWIAACTSSSPASPTSTKSATTTSTAAVGTTVPAPATTAPLIVDTTLPPAPWTSPGWLATENTRPGTADWRIEAKVPGAGYREPEGTIEGWANTTSAQAGQTVTLYVATGAASWRAHAYRMGWYQGALGRLVWSSDEMPTQWQLTNSFDRETRMHRTNWTPSLDVAIDDTWPPGSYLVKLVASTGEAHYVPLTIRRDDAAASLLLVSAVTTWQAYNPWGGRSLYENFGPGSKSDRSRVVSFDRPYARSYNWGSADFLTHELPLIALIEELGIDTNYATNVDLHTSGDGGADVLAGRTAVLTTGHDEYYSTPMRRTLERAVASGVNLAFFGANAVYRHVRLESNDEGVPLRQMPNYRLADADPVTAQDPLQSTVQWRNAPLSEPESALIGVQYFAAGVKAALRVVNPKNWVFEGTDVRNGSSFRGLVAIEADGLGPKSKEPENLEVLASSPVRFQENMYEHAMTYYAHPSGAGVVATGTIAWINALDAEEWDEADTTEFVRVATSNILRAFAAGPCGTAHPSVGNADRYRRPVTPIETTE